MSGPAYYPVRLYRGDTWTLGVRMLRSDSQPVDLTGTQARAQARTGADGPLLFEFDVSIDLTAGRIGIALPPGAPDPGDGVLWDLQLTDPDGTVQTLLSGPVTQRPDITHAEAS